MKAQKNYRTQGALVLYLLIGIALLFQYNGSFHEDETRLFIELMLCYFWTGGLILYAVLFLKLYLFEPLSFISLIYELIFVVKPIIDLHDRDMVEHGVNTFPGGEKATLLFAIGYTVMFFAYYLSFSKRDRPQSMSEPKEDPDVHSTILYISWAVVFVLCLVGLYSQGLSLRYIFTFGNQGDRITNPENIALLFLTNFGATLVTLWLIVIVRTKLKAPKVVITILTVVYLLMRNARWLMLIFLVSPIVYYYTKRKREPRWNVILLVSVAGLLLFAWMQVNRSVLHSGGAMQGWGENGLTLKTLMAPFESDLDTYRAFYAIVMRFPQKFSYLYGKSFLYTFVLFVPRVLWPGKPVNPNLELIEHALAPSARKAGTAMANIGEFYANFGWSGVIIGMFLVGLAARWLKKRFILRDNLSINERLTYSILFPLLFQWIARGNFCGNFYVTIFAILPFFVFSDKFFISHSRSE